MPRHPAGPYLINSLHENTGVQVCLGQACRNASRQCLVCGSVLAPALFCVAIDWMLRHMASKLVIEVGHSHFSNLVYADDTAFLLGFTDDAAISSSSFNTTASTLGLRVLWPKTELQNLGTGAQTPTIMLDGQPVDSVNSFVYLGSSGGL